MTLKQLLRHYGTKSAIARACGVTNGAVNFWFQDGEIPPMREMQLEMLTGGELRASAAARRNHLESVRRGSFRRDARQPGRNGPPRSEAS